MVQWLVMFAAAPVRELLTGLVSLVYPPHCLLCQVPLTSEAADPLCLPCEASLPGNPSPWCQGCGRSLAGFGMDVTRCAACRTEPRGVEEARAACRYEGAGKACIVQLKYQRQLGLAAPMARRMVVAAVPPPAMAADVIVPVPLHPVRRREREFNQSAVLAERLGEALGLPILEEALHRHRPTALQAQLDAHARRRNVANAFIVPSPALVRGRAILLVDDVLTTGATVRACAAALREAGATRVSILTFAHG